jgi:hypothetical protein
LQVTGTYDEAATVFQDVSQQLINGAPGFSPQNWLMFRWSSADQPFFLLTYPSSLSPMDLANAGVGVWELPVSVACLGTAVGAPEDIASFTITNDPSSGANRMMVGPSVLGTVKGDAPTPLLLASTGGTSPIGTADDPGYLASYSLSGGNTHSLLARDLTELTSGVDMGVTVAGAGTNYVDGNYKSCSFATTTMASRLAGAFSTALAPMPGLYRVLLRVVTPLTAGTHSADYSFKVGFSGSSTTYYTDTVVKNMSTQSGADSGYLVDCGVTSIPAAARKGGIGFGSAAATSQAPSLDIQASATAVSGTISPLRFDELILLPADTAYGDAETAIVATPSGGTTVKPIIFDGFNDEVRYMSDPGGTTPFSAIPALPGSSGAVTWIGGLPTVRPGVNNYLQVVAPGTIVTRTTIWSARYYPLYIHPRPSAS